MRERLVVKVQMQLCAVLWFLAAIPSLFTILMNRVFVNLDIGRMTLHLVQKVHEALP